MKRTIVKVGRVETMARADANGVVWVQDITGSWTRCHDLTPAEERRVRRETAPKTPITYMLCSINGDVPVEALSPEAALAAYRADCERLGELMEDDIAVFEPGNPRPVKIYRE